MANKAKLIITPIAEQVLDTRRPPFSACCHLESWWHDGQTSVGSGIIFGPGTIVTCGHNLYRRDLAGWVKFLRVTPGANGQAEPFGHLDVNPRQMETHPSWQGGSDTEADQNDLGIIWSRELIGNITRWSDLTWKVDWTARIGERVVCCGYPRGRPSKTLWLQYGAFLGVTPLDGLLHFTAPYAKDVDPKGLSGAPIWLQSNKPPFVNTVALHKGNGIFKGERSSVAFQMTPDHYELIQRWGRQTGPDLKLLSRRDARAEGNIKAQSAPATPGKAEGRGGGANKRMPSRKPAAAAKAKTSSGNEIQTVLKPEKTHSVKFTLRSKQTANFIIYAQAVAADAGLERCSLVVDDADGGRMGEVELFVNTSGNSFNKQDLSIDAEEAGTYVATIRSHAETDLRVKLKTKIS